MKWKADTKVLVDAVHEHVQDLQERTLSQCKEKERILQFCVFQERTSLELENIKRTLDKLLQDGCAYKQAKSKLEDTVHQELTKLQSTIDNYAQQVDENLKRLEEFEQHKKDIEGRWMHEREKERALMMDKLETLSRLHLMGLDELRVALLNLKVGFGSKIEKLANYLNLPCDMRLGTELHFCCKQEAEAIVSSSRNVSEEDAHKDSSALCAQEQDSSLRPVAFKPNTNDITPIQLTRTASQKRFKSDMNGGDINSHVSTCSFTEHSGQKQDGQSSFEKLSLPVAQSEIAREIMAEMQDLVDKARDLLDQIAKAKKQSNKLAKEMLEEFEVWKKRSTDFDQLLSKFESIKVESKVLSKEPSISCDETMEHWTACLTAVGMDCHLTQEYKPSLDHLLSHLFNIRNTTSNFVRKAAEEVAALEGPGQRLLGLMGASTIPVCVKHHDAILESVNRLPGNGSLEIDDVLKNLEQPLSYDTEKVRCIEQELKEVKDRVLNLICLGKTFSQDLEHHSRWFEPGVIDKQSAARKVESVATRDDCDCATMVIVREQQAHLKKDVDFLKHRVIILTSMLGELRSKSKATGQTEVKLFESSQRMHELDKKIIKMDCLQLNISSNIQDMQFQIKEFEVCAVDWGLKYDTATRVLNELETRLRLVEGFIWRKADNTVQDFFKRKQLLCLHMQEAGNARMDTEPERSACSSNTEQLQNVDSPKQSENRIMTLESRIEHVASAAYANLRILDAKVQQISIGIQTALESAAMAEKKCNALGAELVKVFRNLARSTKGKCLNASRANDGRHSRCAVRRSNVDTSLKEKSSPFANAQHLKRACLRSSLGNHSKEGRVLRMNRVCNTFHWC